MSLSICERFDLDPGNPETPPHPMFLAGKAAGRKEAIADVLRFLRAEASKHEDAAKDPNLGHMGAERCRAKASVLHTMIAYIERGDHETQT